MPIWQIPFSSGCLIASVQCLIFTLQQEQISPVRDLLTWALNISLVCGVVSQRCVYYIVMTLSLAPVQTGDVVIKWVYLADPSGNPERVMAVLRLSPHKRTSTRHLNLFLELCVTCILMKRHSEQRWFLKFNSSRWVNGWLLLALLQRRVWPRRSRCPQQRDYFVILTHIKLTGKGKKSINVVYLCRFHKETFKWSTTFVTCESPNAQSVAMATRHWGAQTLQS